MTLNHLMEKLQSWRFKKCGVPLHCHWLGLVTPDRVLSSRNIKQIMCANKSLMRPLYSNTWNLWTMSKTELCFVLECYQQNVFTKDIYIYIWYIWIKRIWHWITYNGWYTIKPNQTSLSYFLRIVAERTFGFVPLLAVRVMQTGFELM